MNYWGIVWGALGGAAMALPVVVFLSKTLVAHFFAKDLEKYKTDLKKESDSELKKLEVENNKNLEKYKVDLRKEYDEKIEAFKARLQMESQREMAHLKSSIELVAFERQILFSRLHEKRAEIIENMYCKIVDLHKAVSDFVRKFQSVDKPTKEKKLKFLWGVADDFIEYFEKHTIYFDRGVCEKIVSLKEKLSSACRILANFVQEREAIELSYDQLFAVWENAMSTMEQEVPEVKNALEESFRELLGVPKPRDNSHTFPGTAPSAGAEVSR